MSHSTAPSNEAEKFARKYDPTDIISPAIIQEYEDGNSAAAHAKAVLTKAIAAVVETGKALLEPSDKN